MVTVTARKTSNDIFIFEAIKTYRTICSYRSGLKRGMVTLVVERIITIECTALICGILRIAIAEFSSLRGAVERGVIADWWGRFPFFVRHGGEQFVDLIGREERIRHGDGMQRNHDGRGFLSVAKRVSTTIAEVPNTNTYPVVLELENERKMP